MCMSGLCSSGKHCKSDRNQLKYHQKENASFYRQTSYMKDNGKWDQRCTYLLECVVVAGQGQKVTVRRSDTDHRHHREHTYTGQRTDNDRMLRMDTTPLHSRTSAHHCMLRLQCPWQPNTDLIVAYLHKWDESLQCQTKNHNRHMSDVLQMQIQPHCQN